MFTQDRNALAPVQQPPATRELRAQVREFIGQWQQRTPFEPRCDSWMAGFDPEFSRALGQRGWLGMCWPAAYGGGGRPALERYVVIEELLVAGAPVAAHWIADRQTGPSILRYGSEAHKRRYLPAMAQGTCFSALGLSEPDTGSDLASVRTRATRADGGWRLSGTKVWTSHAHRAQVLVVLARSAPLDPARRHDGLTQFIIDLTPAPPGLTVRPIRLMTGEQHFNEVVLTDVFVPDDMVLGTVGNAWQQVVEELANERSGPERFLSTFLVLPELARLTAATADARVLAALATAWSNVWALRQLSISVALMLDRGESPEVEAAVVKSLGTELEQEIVELARSVVPFPVAADGHDQAARVIADGLTHSPGYTLRGGTNEVLRGIVARGLGLR
jgi:acyl-CoA dehydrogenase